MDATGDRGKATAPERATAPEDEEATPSAPPGQRPPFGPDGAAILATEHWSLLASRSLIWNEAQSRATVFLSVLSAATIALALLADATGFGAQTTTLALVLLPVVLFLRPPRRRAGPGGQLSDRRSASATVGPVPGQHPDDRRDGGRRARGDDRRARGAGG